MTRVRAAAYSLKRSSWSGTEFMRKWAEAHIDFANCNYVIHEYQSWYILRFSKYEQWFGWYASKGVEQWRANSGASAATTPSH
jgi:hypothetical protein